MKMRPLCFSVVNNALLTPAGDMVNTALDFCESAGFLRRRLNEPGYLSCRVPFDQIKAAPVDMPRLFFRVHTDKPFLLIRGVNSFPALIQKVKRNPATDILVK